MNQSLFSLTYFILTTFSLSLYAGVSHSSEHLKQAGEGEYKSCYYCHSLKEGVHLTGPSLSNTWGKMAGKVSGFNRYSEAIKKSTMIWNEDTLDSFLTSPSDSIKGTYMIHKGIKDSKARRSLIEILKIAMGPEGAKKVVAQKLLNPEIVDGQIKNLKNLSKSSIVTKIVHCHDVLSVSTADGKTFPYWEMNVSLKFDGSSRGPSTGVPVIIDSGSMGDRKTIIFSSANELKKMMISSCDD